MSLFHRHDWFETDRHATPGVMERGMTFEFGGGLWSERDSDLLYGYTLVFQQCKTCGDSRTRKLAGSWPVPRKGVVWGRIEVDPDAIPAGPFRDAAYVDGKPLTDEQRVRRTTEAVVDAELADLRKHLLDTIALRKAAA